ncbi:hypothetical protein GGD81_003888 [Rhodobium orientis]|nr:hypothetical protein [Rhodobium orientis]
MSMTPEETETERSRPPWRDILVWYMRLLAIHLIGAGIIHWGRIVGYSQWRGLWIWEMPVEWQTVTAFFAVIDLVAAVGLWLTVSWGVVIWLVRVLTQVVMHAIFWDTFGKRPWEITFLLTTVVIYFVLTWLAERERQRE